jgi:hypothetical protein
VSVCCDQKREQRVGKRNRHAQVHVQQRIDRFRRLILNGAIGADPGAVDEPIKSGDASLPQNVGNQRGCKRLCQINTTIITALI